MFSTELSSKNRESPHIACSSLNNYPSYQHLLVGSYICYSQWPHTDQWLLRNVHVYLAILHFMGFEKYILLQYVLANFCYHSKISEIMSLKEGKACFESWFWRFQAMIQRLVTFGSIEKCCMIMRIYGRGSPSPDGCPQAKEGAEKRSQCLSIFFRGLPPVPNFIFGALLSKGSPATNSTKLWELS